MIATEHTGRIIAKGYEEYPLSHPRPDWAEQDVEEPGCSGGCLFVNSSIVTKKIERDDIRALKIPVMELTLEKGNRRCLLTSVV